MTTVYVVTRVLSFFGTYLRTFWEHIVCRICKIPAEDVRAFNSESSKISILPNLIVDSNDVVANHNVTISNINEEELFYLNSKGINESDAIKLLRNGFMLSIFSDEEFKETIKKYL